MITVVDQVKPWFNPSRTFATTIQAQSGARMSSSGTGRPMIQPLTRTGFRPNRSAIAPATTFAAALVRPNASRYVSTAVAPAMWKMSVARSGRIDRS